jgi:DNA-directed RNA polymerase specialized sigma24 family protein
MEPVVNDPSPALLRRCRDGDAGAWRRLFAAHQGFLRARITWLLGRHGRDPNLVDDITEDLWRQLAVGGLLRCYDPRRACFRAFLFERARQEVQHFYRALHSRKVKEVPLRGRDPTDPAADPCPLGLLLEDLLPALSPRLREFALQQFYGTAASTGGPAPSPANARQMESRIRRRIRDHTDER